MALTSRKGRADCRALLRLTKSFSRHVLSSYCSGAVASQLRRLKQSSQFHMNKNEVEIREFEMHLTKFLVCALIS